MLMVIFGAGASHDSYADEPRRRPPLTKDLIGPQHHAITTRYPLSSAVIDYVQRSLSSGDNTTSLERILADFAIQGPNDPRRQKQLVAFRFYLNHLIRTETEAWLQATSGMTHYLTLFNYLAEWQNATGEMIRLVTFNYDTLIENALFAAVLDERMVDRHDGGIHQES